MSQYWMTVAILLPIIGGILVKVIPFPNQKIMKIYLECVMVVTSLLVFLLAWNRPEGTLEVVHFMQGLSISFRIDGMSMVFSVLIAVLWPLAMLYSFEYMEANSLNLIYQCQYHFHIPFRSHLIESVDT